MTKLTNAIPNQFVKIPRDVGGFHILWSVVVAATQEPVVDATTVQLNIYGVAPAGELIPFDGNPYLGNVRTVAPTAYSGGKQIKFEAVGLQATEEVIVEIGYLY
jgi:hypothetical protein